MDVTFSERWREKITLIKKNHLNNYQLISTGNKLHPQELGKICEGLMMNSTLSELDLSLKDEEKEEDNDDEVKRRNTIWTDCDVADDKCRVIGEALKNNDTLMKLNLSCD